jgi:hypothetical protein
MRKIEPDINSLGEARIGEEVVVHLPPSNNFLAGESSNDALHMAVVVTGKRRSNVDVKPLVILRNDQVVVGPKRTLSRKTSASLH